MRQKLGQHFLTNADVLRKIAEIAAPQPNETIIEIGPGHGELTQFLLERKPRRLITIERDEDLAEDLKENFGDALEVLGGDVLEVLPNLAAELAGQRTVYTLVGNIPYYLTGFLLRMIAGLEHKPARSIFTMQKEVAERLTEKPPRMNRLAAALQWWSNPRIIGIISRKDFDPPPEVDSATVLLQTKQPGPSEKESARYYTVVHALFQQPRKTIYNNIQAATGLARDEVDKRLQKIGFAAGERAQSLDISRIVEVGHAFPELHTTGDESVIE